MRVPANLDPTHRRTFEKIFHPSASEPLEWREVRAFFREIAEIGWEANGNFKVSRNGHILILRPAPTKDVSGPDELLELQRFLERSEAMPPLLDPTDSVPEREPLIRTVGTEPGRG